MSISNRDKGILLIILGLAVCVLSVIYVVMPNIDSKKALDAQAVQLQARLTELQSKMADKEKYETGIIEYTQKYESVLNCFPADLNQEITIMFLEGIKDSNEFSVSALSLEEKKPFYTLSGNAGSDATLATTDATSTTSTEAAATTETATTTEAAALTETAEAVDDELVCYSANFPIDYKGSYESLKEVVAYVDNYSDRMTVDTLSIQYDGNNVYSGQLELTCYSVEGESRPERSLDLNEVEIGVDNIFEGTGGSVSSDSSLNKYNDKDGAEIESSYDFYVMLNAASSDVSAKVVGQNGTGKEDTVIWNSDNTISSITYDFYETDGKIYCKYTLDNSLSYEAEVTSAEDVKLLIQSSERKNDEDMVGAKIVIRNTTSLPIYVKVSGDDTVSPRVTVTKSGSVKVYQ